MPVDTCVLDDGQVARLAHTRFGPFVRLGETTSTNSVLVAEAARGRPEGLVVVADHQSAGRGRFERTWESRPGQSLLFSVLLRPGPQQLPARRRHLAAAAVALALAEGARSVAGAEVRLKWPNDVIGVDPVRGEAKVAGILAESADDGAIVVGAGMNVAWAPKGMGATCLDALAAGARGPGAANLGAVNRGDVLVESLLALDRLYGRWDLVSGLYRRSCATLGREVTVTLSDRPTALAGTAVGLDDDGRLVVREAHGELVTVAAGDVSHVRPVPGGPSPSMS
jgi:BirA family biotin operon repressor/biotin-[acetyl-CoA-carboxylase] ligase